MEVNSCINVPLPDDEIDDVIQKAIDWAIMHGISIRSTNLKKDESQIAPFLLLPSTFPKDEFKKAVNIQTVLNELMHKVAYDHEFLNSSLSSTIESDEFTHNLFKIYQVVYNESNNFKKNFNLGILRSDYMIHNVSNKIKQIEINTIASSFGGLTSKVSEFHRFILSILGHSDKLSHLPDNDTVKGISSGLVKAWSLYNNPLAVILFVVEDVTVNISDQRFIEFQIQLLNPKIKIIRRNFKSLIDEAKLSANETLIVGKHEVSVVYYRSGYDPSFYPTENEWKLRLLIEKSKAIKCPSIQYQLAGTKKVQQMLSIPSILKRFIQNEDQFKQVQDLFVNLYNLDFDETGDKVIQMVLENPEKFVLKPQREGGGHNIYGEDIKKKLEGMRNSKDRIGYIIMDIINTPSQENYLIRPGSNNNSKLKSIVSELGIYGVIIGNQEEIVVNNQAGFLLRTKPATSNEGGIVAGFGAIDSPYLVP